LLLLWLFIQEDIIRYLQYDRELGCDVRSVVVN